MLQVKDVSVFLWNWFISTKIGDLPTILLAGIPGLFLVVVVEWLRSPSIRLEIADPVIVDAIRGKNKKVASPRRKIVKIRVIIKKDWRRFLPISKNPHALSKIKVKMNWKTKPEYQAKWDTAPEPWDYLHNVPRPEMAPLAMQADNLMFGDVAEAGIAAKHEGVSGFFLFDSDYYIQDIAVKKNYCTKKKVLLKVSFKSSLTKVTENFIIRNPGETIDSFIFEKADKNDE